MNSRQARIQEDTDFRIMRLLQSQPDISQREQAMPLNAMFHSGDSVVITDGPFAGIEAIYQTADAERRAFILLEILSKPVSMQIDTGRLRKAG